MKIREFPLAWRWTDSRYAVFPEAILSQLQPLELQDAKIAFERARSFQRNSNITNSSITRSADISDEDGCTWLQAQHGDLGDVVTISWTHFWGLRTTWQIFTEHWSDFCYPSDDVTVWPDSEQWVLFYHHEERFYFVQRPAA
jgi:hypothetical protein